MDHLPRVTWSYVGCIGTEERSIACLPYLQALVKTQDHLLLRVRDLPSYYTRDSEKLLAHHTNEISSAVADITISDHALLGLEYEMIDSFESFLSNCGSHLVIDITSLPKRFFFPLIKCACRCPHIENLVIVYTAPLTYSEGNLAEDPKDWEPLPMFAPPEPEPPVGVLVVGAGYEPLGLPALFESAYRNEEVSVLLPFPPGPPHFHRAWEFVRSLDKKLSPKHAKVRRVAALDTCHAFDHLLAVSEHGRIYLTLAPYGPKPISLAMCLYAVAANSAVFYTQPTVYNPHYSKGVSTRSGQPNIHAYCVRLSGRNLYEVA